MSNRGLSDFRLVHGRYREIPGPNYDTPKELWGFRMKGGRGKPQDIARTVLDANTTLLGLQKFPIRQRQVIPSLGGWHVIYDQVHPDDGIRIHRAYVSVHMDLRHEVYLVKNRAVPVTVLEENAKEPHRKLKTIEQVEHRARIFAKGKQKTVVRLQSEPVWFPVRRRLRLAHMFRFRTGPRAEEWIVFMDRENGEILWSYDNLAHANVHARVFDPNPVVALGDWKSLLERRKPIRPPEEAYKQVVLREIASSGALTGPNVAIVVRKRNDGRPSRHDFDRLRSHQHGFEAAMAYFHVDRAVRYVEELGYAGEKSVWLLRTSETDTQTRLPLQVRPRATNQDNSGYYAGSIYSPHERYLAFGTGAVDDAEDGETIVHEFGHALQDAICPDFGESLQGAAMGEGFGDYFAASFFAEKKRKRRKVLLPTVMTWDGILMGDREDKDRPPCVRRLDSTKTYESFNHLPSANEHKNGEIWSATLWDIWKEIKRKAADRIIIESHFQLDGFTTFARGARAIIDAGRNLAAAGVIDNAHGSTLRDIFRRRGIGPVE